MQFTEIDLELGQVYWDILVQIAKNEEGRVVQYAELITIAQQKHPDNAAVQNAIPVSIGRRLDVVHWFCNKNQLPDLACLAVGKAGRPGDRYLKHTDWEAAIAAVRAFDWRDVSVRFAESMRQEKIAMIPKPRRKEQEAEEVLYAHYRVNRARYPSTFQKEARSDFLVLLQEGADPEEAFLQTLQLHR
jgi:predicted DNA-binding ribbon-helix-helix protein